METAGHRPRPRSMLLLLATPVPCALLFTMAASACAAQRHHERKLRSPASACLWIPCACVDTTCPEDSRGLSTCCCTYCEGSSVKQQQYWQGWPSSGHWADFRLNQALPPCEKTPAVAHNISV